MKILFFGGAGYLGSHLSYKCLEYGQELIIYDKFKNINPNDFYINAKIINDDISNASKYLNFFNDVNIILYGISIDDDELKNEQEINKYILNMLHALNSVVGISKDARIIFFSSLTVYENLNGLHDECSILNCMTLPAKLKLYSEEAIQKYFTNYTILRIPNVFGKTNKYEDKTDIYKIIKKIINKEKILIPTNDFPKQYLDIDYVCRIILRLLFHKLKENEIINIGHESNNLTKKQLVEKISESINYKIETNHIEDNEPFLPMISFEKFENYLNELYKTTNKEISEHTIEMTAYDYFFNGKLTFAVEEYDSIIEGPRPNGSSKSWYLKEEGKMDIPKMWGEWNVFHEHENETSKKFFARDNFTEEVTPNFYQEYSVFKYQNEITDKTYIYLINIFDARFFEKNKNIGFKCISQKYLDDTKNGRCKIVLLHGIEGYSGAIYNEQHKNDDLEIINSWIEELNLPHSSIYFLSGNLLIDKIAEEYGIKYKCIPINIFDIWLHYFHVRNIKEIVPFNPTPEKYLYVSYNRSTRYHRIYFATKMLQKGLLDYGKLSLGHFEYVANNEADEFELAKQKLSTMTPLIVDKTLKYTLANVLNDEHFETTFVSVITESLTYKNTMFLTEKIYRPIVFGQPFLLLGNKGSLKKLKEMGYQTFSQWFDETYDDLEEMEQRADAIVNEIDKLKNKSIDELKEIRNQMRDVCIHNRNNFLKVTDIKYTLGNNRFINSNKEVLSIIKQINLNLI